MVSAGPFIVLLAVILSSLITHFAESTDTCYNLVSTLLNQTGVLAGRYVGTGGIR
jgi:hypothetical protein